MPRRKRPDYHVITEDLLRAEIEELFGLVKIRKGRVSVKQLPDYEQLRDRDEDLFEAVCECGGYSRLFRFEKSTLTPSVSWSFFSNQFNLRTELRLFAEAAGEVFRTRLPIYEQMLDWCPQLCRYYVMTGGYKAVADRLGMSIYSDYLRNPENLVWELSSCCRERDEMAMTLWDNEPPIQYVPSEKFLRIFSRRDLIEETRSYGTVYTLAYNLDLLIRDDHWIDNERYAHELNDPVKMAEYKVPKPVERFAHELREVMEFLELSDAIPSCSQLREMRRPDLVRAYRQLGGQANVAAHMGLRLQTREERHPEKHMPPPLDESVIQTLHPWKDAVAGASMTVGGTTIFASVSQRTVHSQAKRYDAWLVDHGSLAGKIGAVLENSNAPGQWLYQTLADGNRWRGAQGSLSLNDALGQIYDQTGREFVPLRKPARSATSKPTRPPASKPM
ncbi:MAG: hypothetical protein EON58_11720 [Alphaproteobacteria bacterium]|nr:MAG: hypothetical protein EON58_11720 [Alphaproteobacteria bacterium]